MKHVILAFALGLSATLAHAEVRTQTVDYKEGDTVLQGFVAWDDSLQGKAPGVLVCHQWKGITEVEKKRAEMLASLGYVAFCADIYGKGVRPSTPQEAGATAGRYKNDRTLLRKRVNAALEELRRQPNVARDRVAAIGYCFGGTAVLELARSGADVAGVVSFHGGLDSPTPEDGKNIKAKVLVLHGADDPFVPAKDIEAFCAELRNAKVDWQMTSYGGAVHSFTDWNMKDGSMPGAAYNENADRRSWKAMTLFFGELFGTAAK